MVRSSHVSSPPSLHQDSSRTSPLGQLSSLTVQVRLRTVLLGRQLLHHCHAALPAAAISHIGGLRQASEFQQQSSQPRSFIQIHVHKLERHRLRASPTIPCTRTFRTPCSNLSVMETSNIGSSRRQPRRPEFVLFDFLLFIVFS